MSDPSPDQHPNAWGDLALDYERAFEGLTTQYAADLLGLMAVKPGERVIDVAAGTGAFSFLAARAGAEVFATDIAPGMIKRLRARAAEAGLPQVSAEVMDGQALRVPDASFDAAASILGLIFFPDIRKGLSEMRRVLRPGGRAGIVCWSDPADLMLMTEVVRSIQAVVPDYCPPSAAPAWARLAGADTVREELRMSGFRDVEVTTLNRSLVIESPETFWKSFARSAPPLAYLFGTLGPEVTAEVGRVYVESIRARSGGGTPSVSAGACLGIGRV